MPDDSIYVPITLFSLQCQLLAHEVALAYTIGLITDADAAKSASAHFRDCNAPPEVQKYLDNYADRLLDTAQFKTTSSGFHVIDGGKDDLMSTTTPLKHMASEV